MGLGLHARLSWALCRRGSTQFGSSSPGVKIRDNTYVVLPLFLNISLFKDFNMDYI